MTRDWIKIDPGLGMEDIEDDDDGFDLQILASRTYGFKGKPFPRISITIHPDLGVFSGNKDITGVRVGLDKKSHKKAWWQPLHDGLPLELVPELIDILQEAQQKISRET